MPILHCLRIFSWEQSLGKMVQGAFRLTSCVNEDAVDTAFLGLNTTALQVAARIQKPGVAAQVIEAPCGVCGWTVCLEDITHHAPPRQNFDPSSNNSTECRFNIGSIRLFIRSPSHDAYVTM